MIISILIICLIFLFLFLFLLPRECPLQDTNLATQALSLKGRRTEEEILIIPFP